MPCDYSRYPPDWKLLRQRILVRAGHRCEKCGAENYQPHPVTGSRVVLTISHTDHDIANNDYDNLRALCNACHLAHDARQHAASAAETRRRKREESGQIAMELL